MTGARQERIEPSELMGWARWGAVALCGLPVLLGFVLPVILLLGMASGSEQDLFSPRYLRFVQNSLTLAGLAAAVTVAAAVMIGFYQRIEPGPLSRTSAQLARIGYAVPGGVIAVGLLVPFAAFDNAARRRRCARRSGSRPGFSSPGRSGFS